MLAATAWPAPAARDTTEENIWRRPGLNARIEPGKFDRGLMAAAVFHETNRIRRQLGLNLFKRLVKLDEAADLEARLGNVVQPPSHTNPFPMIGTPLQRVENVGLKPHQVAENIALLSIYEIDPRTGIGVTTFGGRRRFVNPETQEELRPATYLGLAKTVVRAWMESPGHRENLVAPTLAYLGCSVQPTITVMSVESLFCVQVFFTPASKTEQIDDHTKELPRLW